MTSSGNNVPTDGNLVWTQSDESLINAVTKRDISKIRSLMKKKVNPTKISPKLGIAAIHQAACYEKADVLKALMVFPLINVNKTDARKRAPVHHAAREGREECLEHLIQYQADTKLVENEGLTPLHLASMLGHLGCVQLLIPTLPSLEAKDTNGRTALCHAASRGSASICRLLLENGANVDSTDNDGKSSIMAAAENGHQAAFQYLLANRANVKLRDKKGRDVYWYAGSQVDYLLGLPSPSRIITARQSSNDSHSRENAIRDAVSSQPNLSSRRRPEPYLTQSKQSTPKNQDSVSATTTTTTTTESDLHSRRISNPSLKTRNAQNTGAEQRDGDSARSTVEKQTLEKSTAGNDELSVSTDEETQNFSNIRPNQHQIRVLVEEAVRILTSSRQHPSSDDEVEEESRFQKAVKKLSLTLKFLDGCDSAGPDAAVAGVAGSESVLEELRKESALEIERLRLAMSDQKEVIARQTIKLRQYEEKIREYAETLREQAAVLRRFERVKETVVKVTELDDVDDDRVADVIREIADQCERLHVANQQLEARCAAQQLSVVGGENHPLVEQPKQWNGKASDELKNESESESESRTPISDLLKNQIAILRRSLENQIAILVGSDVILPTTVDDVIDDVINAASFERERQNRFRETVVASNQGFRTVGQLPGITDGNRSVLVPDLEVEEGHYSNGASERTAPYPPGTSVASTNFEDSGFPTIYSDPDDDRGLLLCSPDCATDTIEDNRSLRSLKARTPPAGDQRQHRPVKTKSSETQTTTTPAWQNDSGETLISELKRLTDENSTLQTELSLLRKGSLRSRRENRGGSEDRKKRKRDGNDAEKRDDKNSILSQEAAPVDHQVDAGAMTESDSSGESLNSETVKHSTTAETITSINYSPAAGKLEETKTKTEPSGSAEIEKPTLGKVSEKPPHPKHSANSRSLNASSKQKSVSDTNLTLPSTLKVANEDGAVTSTHEPVHLGETNITARLNARRKFHSDGKLDRNSGVHGDSNSSEEENFERIFLANNQSRQNRKNSVSEIGSKARRSSSKSDIESVSLENERLREELLRLKSEMKILYRHQRSAILVGQRTASNALESSIARSFEATDQQMNSKNEVQDDNKSLDGYRFLSEDENGTLKFKEFPLTNSGQLEIVATPRTNDFKRDSDSVTSLSSSFSDSASQAEDGEKTRKISSGIRNSSKRQKETQQKRKTTDKINSTHRLATSVKESETRFLNAPENLEISAGRNICDQYQRLVEEQLKDESTTPRLSLVSKNRKSGIMREKSTSRRKVSMEDHQIEIVALRKQIQEFERQHKLIIGIYRGHLLASIQGCLDSDVADALLRIVTLQDNRR